MKYNKIDIIEGTEKQIKFAKDLQNSFFDDLEDDIDDNEDIEENVNYYLARLSNNAKNWINAIHVYKIKNYALKHGTLSDITRKLDIAIK